MCGICGIISEAGVLREDSSLRLEEMKVTLTHRGPDQEGTVQVEGAVFGHRRLAVISPDDGLQPMQTPDGRYTLVFNGEIYNYLELREELEASGIRFRTPSDTEVLLWMLVVHGVKALSKLNGMFAFAFYDRESRETLLARDHFGIKPLYYLSQDGEWLFASEIKALTKVADRAPEADWAGLQQYLTFQYCLHGQTLFKGVRALRPGKYAIIRGAELQEHWYWDTVYEIDPYHNEDYYIDRIRELLADSARLQIRSDVPLGAYLSGGIDSSLMASLAREQTGKEIPGFHGKFLESPDYDESRFARDVAEHAGLVLHEIVPTAQDFADTLPKLIYHMDEPVAGPGLFPQYMVSKAAREHVTVVLGGQGGDELFCGYARYLVGYLEQAMKGAIFENQEEGRHLVTLHSIVENLPVLQKYAPLMQQFWRDGLFGDMDARYFRLIDRSPDLDALLTSDAQASFDKEQIFADFQKVFNHADTKSYVNKMTHFDQKTLLPALLQVEDRVSMAVSLESRVPILDHRIVDLVTRMPPAIKFQGGRTKHILKKSVQGLIPESVLWRKDKMGFPVPMREWMQGGVVREFVADTLLSSACRERGLYDPAALEALIDGESQFGRQLWGALCLELWYQTFIDAA